MGGRPVKPYYLWTSRRANHPRHHDPRLRHAEGMNSSILQPSTVRQVGCAQEREDLRSTGSSFGGVCATATSSLPPSLSARRKLEAKRRQTCYTIYTATPTTTKAHVRQAEAAQKQQAARLAAGYDTAMLLAYLLLFLLGVMSIVRSSVCVCALRSKTLCVQVCDTLRPATDAA